MGVNIELQGFPEFGRRLSQYDQRQRQDILQTMSAGLSLLEADQRRNVAQDTRRLMGSITHQIDSRNLPFISGRVGPTVRYGLWVERGRRPGKAPPIEAIAGWARRHGVNPFVVARAIARRGTRPQPFVEPSLQRNLPALRRMFGRIGFRLVTFLGRPA